MKIKFNIKIYYKTATVCKASERRRNKKNG